MNLKISKKWEYVFYIYGLEQIEQTQHNSELQSRWWDDQIWPNWQNLNLVK